MKIAAWLLLALTFGVAGCTPKLVTLRQAHDAAVHIVLDNGSCSGTVIGPHAILSATHCFQEAHEIAIDGRQVAVIKSYEDGNDHTILIVDREFRHWAELGGKPEQAADVFVFGNPAILQDIFRRGVVSGSTVLYGKHVDLYDLNGWMGDSGSGIFDANGRIIGVISIVVAFDQGVAIKLMGSYPIQFSPAQWAEINASH